MPTEKPARMPTPVRGIASDRSGDRQHLAGQGGRDRPPQIRPRRPAGAGRRPRASPRTRPTARPWRRAIRPVPQPHRGCSWATDRRMPSTTTAPTASSTAKASSSATAGPMPAASHRPSPSAMGSHTPPSPGAGRTSNRRKTAGSSPATSPTPHRARAATWCSSTSRNRRRAGPDASRRDSPACTSRPAPRRPPPLGPGTRRLGRTLRRLAPAPRRQQPRPTPGTRPDHRWLISGPRPFTAPRSRTSAAWRSRRQPGTR